MPNVTANGIQIEYDTFGDPVSKPLLLIMGWACPLIYFDEPLCKQLAEAGHYVIRFDNRDIGLSTKMEDAGVPDIMKAVMEKMQGEPVNAPYTTDDMAEDTIGLLDALGIEKAHICGMSMGGVISQIMAIKYPERLLSLTLIYSGMGSPEDPPPNPEIAKILTGPRPESREESIDMSVNTFRLVSGSGFEFDEDWHRKISAQAYDRCYYPDGLTRQYVAVIAGEDRKPALSAISIPTLIIHGIDDPLSPVERGKNMAATIPNAELLLIEGMGHSLPHDGPWPQIIDAIAKHTSKVTR
jgi:pimeloyl-ACP methyl ester carboxylesterase